MSRRIEVELTSRRDDGSWTWRAAGAKQPKGIVDGGLIPDGLSVGDVVRAEADFEIDGIFINEVLPPKARSGKPESERIELKGRSRGDQLVTHTDASGRPARRRRDDDDDESQQRARGGRNKGGARANNRKRRDDRRDGKGRGKGDSERAEGSQDSDKSGSPKGDDKRRGRGRDGDKRKTEAPPRPKTPKLRPGRKHRKALIDSLPPEQQVVAEQLARGGMAAVRKELDAQNEQAQSEGGPEVPAEGIIALAESLVGKVQQAEWQDRAAAALSQVDKVDVRDIRSVLVAAQDFARDNESRELAQQISDALDQRIEQDQVKWHDELRETLADGRVVRALRLSSRPPKAGSPLPPEIAQQMTEQANTALGTGASQHRIAVVLEAVAYSPVRPYVILPQIPDSPEEELLETLRRHASRLPEIAKAFGIDPQAAGAGRWRRGKQEPASEEAAEAAAVTDEAEAAEADTQEVSAENPAAADDDVAPAAEVPATGDDEESAAEQ